MFFFLSALNDDHFFFAGQIMAMSLVHGGPAPYFLSPLLYDALLFGPRQVTVSVGDIYDYETRKSLQQVLCSIL